MLRLTELISLEISSIKHSSDQKLSTDAPFSCMTQGPYGGEKGRGGRSLEWFQTTKTMGACF